jgi:hypothetical protein
MIKLQPEKTKQSTDNRCLEGKSIVREPTIKRFPMTGGKG